MYDFDENTDFESLSDAQLKYAETKYLPYTRVYEKAIEEICKRQSKNKAAPHWHSNPLIISFFTLCALVAAAWISYYFGWLH